jgi:hypothetical protein
MSQETIDKTLLSIAESFEEKKTNFVYVKTLLKSNLVLYDSYRRYTSLQLEDSFY